MALSNRQDLLSIFSKKRTVFYLFELLLTPFFLWMGNSSFAQTPIPRGNAKADSLYTQAQIELSINNDAEKAESLFKQVLELQPDNADAHAQLSTIYQGQGNYTEGQKEISNAVKLEPDNLDYKNKLAEFLVQQGKYDDALEIYKVLAQKSNPPTEYILKEVYIYDVQQKYGKALELLNTLPRNANVDREALLNNKFKLYAKLDNVDSASAMLKLLVNEFPDKPEYYIMSAITFQELKDTAAALKVIDTANAKFPTDFKVVEQVVLFYARFDRARLENFFDQNLASNQYTAEQKTTLFFPLITLSQDDSSITPFINRKLPELAFGNPANEAAILVEASWRELQKDTLGAINICKKGVALFPDNIHLWNGIITAYRQINQEDSVNKYNQLAAARLPESRFPVYSLAISSLDAKDTTKAISYLEQIKAMQDTDSTISDYTVYSVLGSLYQSVNNDDSAEVNFKQAVAIDDRDPFILNNYSYLLAQKGIDLDNALQMSGQSLTQLPDEVNFLDTYGWILFKQKKFVESKKYLEKALEKSPHPSAVLYEHLGDVENALGNKKKAKRNWKKSLDLNGSNQELQQKLEK